MMQLSLMLSLMGAVGIAHAAKPVQEQATSLATVSLADGTTVALVEWKLSYEFITWNKNEPMSLARVQVRESATLIVGNKNYAVKSDSLSLTHAETAGAPRVVSMNLKKAGDIRVEAPAQKLLAPDIDKKLFFQVKSLDLSGETLSGTTRSFCVASFSALVDCGASDATRVIRVVFN